MLTKKQGQMLWKIWCVLAVIGVFMSINGPYLLLEQGDWHGYNVYAYLSLVAAIVIWRNAYLMKRRDAMKVSFFACILFSVVWLAAYNMNIGFFLPYYSIFFFGFWLFSFVGAARYVYTARSHLLKYVGLIMLTLVGALFVFLRLPDTREITRRLLPQSLEEIEEKPGYYKKTYMHKETIVKPQALFEHIIGETYH